MYFFRDLQNSAVPSEHIEYLKKLKERDGFQFIKEQDYLNMKSFLNEYLQDYGKIIPIITDNNGNYLCVSSETKSLGSIVLLSPDEPNLRRVFKDIPNMVDMINKNNEFWDIFDFPSSFFS